MYILCKKKKKFFCWTIYIGILLNYFRNNDMEKNVLYMFSTNAILFFLNIFSLREWSPQMGNPQIQRQTVISWWGILKASMYWEVIKTHSLNPRFRTRIPGWPLPPTSILCEVWRKGRMAWIQAGNHWWEFEEKGLGESPWKLAASAIAQQLVDRILCSWSRLSQHEWLAGVLHHLQWVWVRFLSCPGLLSDREMSTARSFPCYPLIYFIYKHHSTLWPQSNPG